MVHLSSEAWLCVPETWINVEEHQVVPEHGYHMERTMCCPGWKDLFVRQWSFTLLTHTDTKIKVYRVFLLNFTSSPQKFGNGSDE